MLSVNPNPPPQSFFCPSFSASSASASSGAASMALPGLGPLPPAAGTSPAAPATPQAASTAMAAVSSSAVAGSGVPGSNGSSASEDPNKKIRKPYTITKSRESWSEQEHDKFLEALQLFDRDWKKIEAFVGSKTVIQIRSHAQKYFLKVQKNGTSEHVPPPRPKRKAAHPYPQKASKNAAPVVSKSMDSLQSSSAVLEPGYILRPDSSSVLGNSNAALSSWTYNLPPPKMAHEDIKPPAQQSSAHNHCCSSSSEDPKTWPSGEGNNQKNHSQQLRVMPDFAQVYSFIGSVFDPDASNDHLQTLKKMDPINLETVLLLMRNLSVNLTRPEFEDHRKLLSSYDVDSYRAISHGLHSHLNTDKLQHAVSSV